MSYAAFGNKDIRRFFWAFWLAAFVLLQFFLQYFFKVSAATAFTDNFVSILLLIVFIGIANSGGYVTRLEGYQFLPALFILTILSAICLSVTAAVLYYINKSDSAYIKFLFTSLPYRFLYTWFIISGLTFMNYIWHKALERNTMQKRDEDLQKMAKDAELHKIYQQLQPHFLFNSLNSINTLISNRPEEAGEMVQNLSDFLRGSLKKVDTDTIPFQDEIKHLSLYLKLEKVRFGERLQTKIDIDKNTAEASIPPLILQPLIENAIKFGLYGTLGNVTISLKVAVIRNYLQILITNPFDDDAQPPKGTGFGLKAVKRRLYLIFARNDLLQTRKGKHIFITRLKIPQKL